MIKIAICGKAGSGKDTAGQYFRDLTTVSTKIAFADPIKEIARTMFPYVPRKCFYGDSKYRATIIPKAFKNGQPLTVRQLLIDIGTGLGRQYYENTWLDAFDFALNKAEKNDVNLVIVTDVRFRNEFDHLKSKGFFMIRLKRNEFTAINDISETNQDGILDSEFDCILENNETKDELNDKIIQIYQKVVDLQEA
jgi:hypothetical protein